MKEKNYITEWNEVENKLLGNNALVEVVNGDKMTTCRYKINKKVNIPSHSHDYEQTIYVLEGEMNIVIEEKQIFMKSGDVCVILGNANHSAEIVGVPFQSLESYYPIRTDLLEKTTK